MYGDDSVYGGGEPGELRLLLELIPFSLFCLKKRTCIPYDGVPSRGFVFTVRVDHFVCLEV